MESKLSQQEDIYKAIILAGGSGQRFQDDIPKQYHFLGEYTVLEHALTPFLEDSECNEIILVINPEHQNYIPQKIKIHKKVKIASCGKTRFQSFLNGLESLSEPEHDVPVLVHDAARPFLETDLVSAAQNAVRKYGAAALSVPVADTLRYGVSAEEGAFYAEKVERNSLRALQTPQGAMYSIFFQARDRWLKNNSSDDFPDETLFIESAGFKAAILTGSRKNFKITTQDDIITAKTMIKPALSEIKTCMGYDIHAYENQSENTIIKIGGIDIQHTHAIRAHSDGDVVLHALTDALLGLTSSGDIGDHFPPDNKQWKNADSMIFVRKALSILNEKGGKISNADITVVCEKPKIRGYRNRIEENIAQMLDIQKDKVSLKATTAEKLGTLGRGEGIEATVICTASF